MDLPLPDSVNYRRHKKACASYRERWFLESSPGPGETLYQVFCLQGTPPVTLTEQDKCMSSPCKCWRLNPKQK